MLGTLRATRVSIVVLGAFFAVGTLCSVALVACKDDVAESSSAPTGPTPAETADACSVDPRAPSGTCAGFFGRPNEMTGLTTEQCAPRCVQDGQTFEPPTYDDAFLQSLVSNWKLATPFPELTSDPYAEPASPPPEPPAETVCGVLPGPQATPRSYTLVTYASESEARASGASPTHFGRCGVCSTLENLAVYIRENDLTAPVRACALKGLGQASAEAQAANVACLRALGFDEPCAQVWFYNSRHTREQCLDSCLAELSNPYHLPDGTLNPCLQCDETKSGAVFKAIAGRTRRNSGLANAMCRPCSEVQPLVHSY